MAWPGRGSVSPDRQEVTALRLGSEAWLAVAAAEYMCWACGLETCCKALEFICTFCTHSHAHTIFTSECVHI